MRQRRRDAARGGQHIGRQWGILAALGLLLLAWPAALASGDCRVEGRVVDPGGDPVSGATIVVEPTAIVATTGEDGRYCIAALPAVTVRLRAVDDARGRAVSRPLRLEEGEPGVTVDLELEPSLREKIVVTGTRTPRKLAEVPVRVEVIEREAITASESRTLADAVELAPGVRVENNCQNCNFAQVRLLGLQGAYSQILIDGKATLSSLAAVYGIEHIPAEFIDRLEVVKGGGSALYGPGSVAGVVNVIPREPSKRGGKLSVRQSMTDEEPGTSVTGAYEWISEDSRTGVAAYGQHDDLDAIDTTGDGFSEIGRRELSAVGARLVHRTASETSRFTLDTSMVEESRRGGNKLDRPVQLADTAEAVDSTRRSVSLRWDYRRGEAFDAHLTIARAETDRDTYYGANQDPNAFGTSENDLTVFEAQINHRRDNHVFTWGGGFSRDALRDGQPAYDRFIDEAYRNVGAFAQSDWKISEKLELVSGVRVDDFSELDGVVVSPRAALRYSPKSGINVRASLATGFRGPQVFDEDLHITQVGGEGAVIRNAPDLEEENSVSTMLGVEWLPMWSGGQARAEANLFFTHLDDIFLVEQRDDPATPGQLEFTRLNGGAARVYGMEVGGSVALGTRVTADGGIVLQRARLEEPEGDFGSRDIFRTPEFYATASVIYGVRPSVDLRATLRYTGSMKVPHYAGFIPEDRLETTPSFTTLDLGVAWLLPLQREGLQLELKAGIRNVTNAFQSDFDEGVERDAGYVYGPRVPRQVYVGAGVDF